MVQFLSIIFFLGFLQFLLGFSKVPFFCVTLFMHFFFSENPRCFMNSLQDINILRPFKKITQSHITKDTVTLTRLLSFVFGNS